MYMRKVKLLESSLKGVRPPTGHNPPAHQTVDKYAAARFIKRGIGKVCKVFNISVISDVSTFIMVYRNESAVAQFEHLFLGLCPLFMYDA